MDTDTVQQFVNAIAATELIPLPSEPHNGRVHNYGGVLPGSADPALLELPPGIQWLSNILTDSNPLRLYVRPAYQTLLLLAMAFVDHPEVPHHRVVIVGSSGTGKTSFLSWVLRYLCRLEKPPVIVLNITGFFGRISSDGEVTAGIRGSSFQLELALRSTVYLCDFSWTDEIDLGIRARTIVMSPPTQTVTMTGPADTMRTLVLVMPVWTLAELETCRSTCYSHTVSQETLFELYQLWGGAVRWTLGTSKQEAKREFTQSIESLSFSSVVEVVGNGGLVELQHGAEDIAVGLRLIHLNVDPDSTFQLTGATMCSTSACSLLISANSKQLESVQVFIETTRLLG
ncbi:hypothetical protein L917_11809 [Phytophthora nicotianae]|uniref:Uncharacterized protein n=1 Tax=Phytophthora nicotianae TaxID=4792 RepID=W2KX99_PHYNI|nr:hypothetical protein L917_11809 [Phytophthora nicotianae]ETM42468.1 hypothetical protein L914_11877 [Phytophthora nicotianae]